MRCYAASMTLQYGGRGFFDYNVQLCYDCSFRIRSYPPGKKSIALHFNLACPIIYGYFKNAENYYFVKVLSIILNALKIV